MNYLAQDVGKSEELWRIVEESEGGININISINQSKDYPKSSFGYQLLLNSLSYLINRVYL